ncbi:MAG: FG-GAP repeat protein, partial [Planctomycetes bacterium]|nr:FG-GAP repeat protein [Planctomycetota bacterium]
MLATRHSYLKQSLSASVGLIALTGMTLNAQAQCQLQKLLAADGAAFDSFGNPVAISGDTAVIGAGQFSFFSPGSGVAYVFEKVGGVWTQTAKLTASDWAWGDEFGISVAVSGNTTVIGARRHTCEGGIEDCGAAYMFEKVAGVWTQTAKLTAADGAVAGFFGASVAISGLTAVIGASGHDALGSFSGSAYVFEKVGGVWTQTAKLTA